MLFFGTWKKPSRDLKDSKGAKADDEVRIFTKNRHLINGWHGNCIFKWH